MTSKEYPTIDRQQIADHMNQMSYDIGLLLGTIERLEQENANLKSSLHEVCELLQRCYDALDAAGGHVDVQEDIDALVYALRVNVETEGVPLERRYTARELMAMPRAQRYAILKKAADEAAEMGLYTEEWFTNEVIPNADEAVTTDKETKES